jgi:hypothetical protein
VRTIFTGDPRNTLIVISLCAAGSMFSALPSSTQVPFELAVNDQKGVGDRGPQKASPSPRPYSVELGSSTIDQ